MNRIFITLAFAGALALGACTAPITPSETTAIVGDAQALLTAAEANGSISTKNGALVADVITGFSAVASTTEASIAAGDTQAFTALHALSAAVGEVAADATSSTVKSDATHAQALIAELGTGSITQAQVEAAVGTFLIDYLATASPASATPGTTSSTAQLITDARAHIATLD